MVYKHYSRTVRYCRKNELVLFEANDKNVLASQSPPTGLLSGTCRREEAGVRQMYTFNGRVSQKQDKCLTEDLGHR